MKVIIPGIVDEVGAHLIDGKEYSYFDLKQPGDQFRAGEIIRISGNGHSKGDKLNVNAELRLEKGKLKIRQLKEEAEEAF